jgi:hypothetical protein
MVRNYIFAAVLAVGGLFIATSAAPAAPAAHVAVGVDVGPTQSSYYTPVYHRGWRHRHYSPRWRYYRPPPVTVYVSPRYYGPHRCWINRWGDRVCRSYYGPRRCWINRWDERVCRY